jgi:hypothetical protein
MRQLHERAVFKPLDISTLSFDEKRKTMRISLKNIAFLMNGYGENNFLIDLFPGLARLGFIPAGFFGFFGFNPLLAQTTNLGFFKNEA